MAAFSQHIHSEEKLHMERLTAKDMECLAAAAALRSLLAMLLAQLEAMEYANHSSKVLRYQSLGEVSSLPANFFLVLRMGIVTARAAT